jgi:cellulose synthase/poly-beta-1,6-N-acetylglucosamine synthase-like glycosyltransferase
VVADNCTDDTAKVARAAGAEVVERHDPLRVGKGYALDWGIASLVEERPDVVVVIDADCRIGPASIELLARTCALKQRPAQALYLMNVLPEDGLQKKVAAFAWRVKNWIRPLGLSKLGLPSQLTGTGMAFPWQAIRSVNVASGWIVEDLKLGLDLALAGYPPLFCPSARVSSSFAGSDKAAIDQRSRWEHGHVAAITTLAPQVLRAAFARRDISLATLGLDLAVPPLSLLAFILMGCFAITGLATLLGLGRLPFIVSSANLLLLTTATSIAWHQHGRDVLPVTALLSVPAYIFSKARIYSRFFLGRRTVHWIRTDRSSNFEQ